VPACASCHGPRGHGTPELPRLAGQHAQYTERQLKAFHQRERTNDNAVMHRIASRLTELENAPAAFISGLDDAPSRGAPR
jgi:cytochrome c553